MALEGRGTLHLSSTRSNRFSPRDSNKPAKASFRKPHKSQAKSEPRLDSHTRRLEALKTTGTPCTISLSCFEEPLLDVVLVDYDKYTVEVLIGGATRKIIFKAAIAEISIEGDWPQILASVEAPAAIEVGDGEDDNIGNRIS